LLSTTVQYCTGRAYPKGALQQEHDSTRTVNATGKGLAARVVWDVLMWWGKGVVV